MEDIKVIAFYLPQYHPTPDNDIWWGKGFTEWTNVGKAKKLYPGHYQPKVPADLGYYDLRVPEVREQQAELAREAGVSAFCYYHYWFGNGKQELELPFNEVVASGKPDFPFCLCWANESWYSKTWTKDGESQKKCLVEQTYPGKEDNIRHFMQLLDAFKDERYLRIGGRLLFVIYKPLDFEHFEEFKKQWNGLAKEYGLPGFFFVGQTYLEKNISAILNLGFDGINHCNRLDNIFNERYPKYLRYLIEWIKKLLKIPFIVSYKKAIKNSVRPVDMMDNVYPTIMPNWDHTPRSADGGSVLQGATPELFQEHAVKILSSQYSKKQDNAIVFLKSWNEWGEGNYMEPDIKYGHGYIVALKNALQKIKK